MKNKYLVLRHAETIKDPEKHPKDWLLTHEALDKINEYIKEEKFSHITKIVSSTEPKAVATGKPIGEYLSLPILEMEEFVEVKREKKFLTDEEFLIQKQKELELRNEKVNSVESGDEAIARFKSGIVKLESEHENENILIITHGTIMTLSIADYKNDFLNIFENWKKLKFCELINLN
jgi:2,3-bisphosphoglycerate-dependent phosphoglycerate mutase